MTLIVACHTSGHTHYKTHAATIIQHNQFCYQCSCLTTPVAAIKMMMTTLTTIMVSVAGNRCQLCHLSFCVVTIIVHQGW